MSIGPAQRLPPEGQVRRLELFGTQGVVSRCRDYSRQALLDWRWLPAADEEQQAVAEDVLLLVSELVTNACLHAGGPHELVLYCTGDRLRVEVSDSSPVHPSPRPLGSAATPGGHGLRVVERLARSWGSVPRGAGKPGKTVWVEVQSPLHRALR